MNWLMHGNKSIFNEIETSSKEMGMTIDEEKLNMRVWKDKEEDTE